MTTLSVKIKESRDHYSYKNKINGADHKLIAQLFSDLELHGIPIKKACETYMNKKWIW